MPAGSWHYKQDAGTAGSEANYPALRIHAVNHSREGDDLANVFGAANPGDGTLEAQSEAGMRNATVAPQVEIPLESLFGQFVLLEALEEQVVIVDALAAADDFAIALGGNHVKGESELGALGVRLHVKGFNRSGIVMDQHGAVEGTGDDGFFVAAEVVAEFGGIAVLVEDRDGVFVADAWERGFHVFEHGGVALKRFELARFVFEDALHDSADEAFAERHDFLELDVSGFGLEHPEFREVAAGFGFFGAEGRAERINLA